MKFIYILFVTLCFTIYACGKIYDRYELAQLLYNSGINNIATMMCIIGRQSNYTTNIISQAERGKRGYGIFQIYYPFWCDQNQNGKGCNMSCDQLLDDDLSDDIQCLKIVLRQQGIVAFDQSYVDCVKLETGNVPDWVWITEQKTTGNKRCPPRRHRNQFV